MLILSPGTGRQVTLFLLRSLCPFWRSEIRTVYFSCWTPTRVCVATTLFIVYVKWMDITAESRRVSQSETARSTVCFVKAIWCCFHPLNRVFNMHLIGLLLCVTELEWKSTLSRNPSQCKLHVNRNTLQQVEKFNYLGVIFTSDGIFFYLFYLFLGARDRKVIESSP